MANRRYTSHEDVKVGPNHGSPPKPGLGSARVKKFDKETPPPYSGAPGPKGHGYSRGPKYPEVKSAVKKDY